MSDTKFTQGEWTRGGDYTTDNLWVSPPNANDNVICDIVRRYPANMTEDEANAHLIATAPDLYKALEYYAHSVRTRTLHEDGMTWTQDDDDGQIARAALAKARGEPDYSTEPTKTAPKRKAAA